MTPRGTTRWTILGIVFLCMLSFALVYQSVPPILSLVIAHFHITHQQASLLMSIFALPGILVSLPAGILADRYGTRRVGIVCLLLTIAGTVMVATGQTFTSLIAGRLLAGVGAMSLVIICPQAIAQWFIGKEMGVAMGVFNAAVPLGTIASLNGLGALAASLGWRSSIWVTAGVSVIALVMFATLFEPAPAPATREKPEGNWSTSILSDSGFPIWLVAVAWGLFNASFISLFTFAPDFMVSRGLSPGNAGFNTSLVMMGALVLSPVIGYAIDKVGRKEGFIAVGGLGMALLLLLVSNGAGQLTLVMGAIGIAAALVPAPIFSLATDVVSPEHLGVGFGILATLNNLGVFVGPQLVGFSRDIAGSYKTGFGMMALFAILVTASISALWLRRLREISPVAKRGKEELL